MCVFFKLTFIILHAPLQCSNTTCIHVNLCIQGDIKKRELLKNPTKIEEIQEKNLLAEIEPLQFAFSETVIKIINV